MNITRSKKILAATAVGVVALSGVGVAAWADGTTSTTTPATATSPAAPAKTSPRGGLLGRMDHGVLEVKNDAGKWVTVDFDRGKVTDVAADHITLARPDGQSVTLKLGPETKYHGVSSAADIKTGKGAAVVSNPAGTALQLVQSDHKKPTPQPAA